MPTMKYTWSDVYHSEWYWFIDHLPWNQRDTLVKGRVHKRATSVLPVSNRQRKASELYIVISRLAVDLFLNSLCSYDTAISTTWSIERDQGHRPSKRGACNVGEDTCNHTTQFRSKIAFRLREAYVIGRSRENRNLVCKGDPFSQ